MTGIEPEVVVARPADDRRTVRRHRAQAGPELRLGLITGAAEQVLDGMGKRGLSGGRQVGAEARDLGHATDTDAVAQTGYRHLVGLVHDGRDGCTSLINDGNGD